jgi:hypothetical protein
MKHAKPTRAWRPVRAYRAERRVSRPEAASEGLLTALIFNLCLLLLPLTAAAAVAIIARDRLYAFEYSDAAARSIGARVERLNSELVQVDFDRHRQWDNLVAMELMANDASAARGFLLSATAMLPSSMSGVLRRAANENAGDAALEVAALQLLTPGTRERYQAVVPLLSLRSARARPATAEEETLADPRDFELMARALISEPETDPLQFVLAGFSLGLAGEMSPDMNAGARVLRAATRRDDFPHTLGQEVAQLAAEATPIAAFREAALANGGANPGEYDNAARAFSSSLNEQHAAKLRALLGQLGDISAATSENSAAALLMHANSIGDAPRLRLLALTAGDRAAAAAKRLPRDGRLAAAAHGELHLNRDLTLAFVALVMSLLGLFGATAFRLTQILRDAANDDHSDLYESELLDMSVSSWRPL